MARFSSGFLDAKSINKLLSKKMAIAVFLRNELHRKNISLAKFAKIMERHPPEITKWLSGRHNFTLNTLFEIELKLGVDFFQIKDLVNHAFVEKQALDQGMA